MKKLYQEWSIPPWLRDSIPLIYLDGQLAAVPGYLLCEPFDAGPGEPTAAGALDSSRGLTNSLGSGFPGDQSGLAQFLQKLF